MSTLVRSWVAERVGEEMPHVPLQALRLPNGKVLTKDSYANELESALAQYESGRLELTARERRTLENLVARPDVDTLEKKVQTRNA